MRNTRKGKTERVLPAEHAEYAEGDEEGLNWRKTEETEKNGKPRSEFFTRMNANERE